MGQRTAMHTNAWVFKMQKLLKIKEHDSHFNKHMCPLSNDSSEIKISPSLNDVLFSKDNFRLQGGIWKGYQTRMSR